MHDCVEIMAISRTYAAYAALAGLALALGASCRSDPNDLPHPETSQGEELGDPAAQQAPLDPTDPIDPDRPEDRMTTVESPPETPPEGQ